MSLRHPSPLFFFFFFNDTATTEIYTLSLHDALPICPAGDRRGLRVPALATRRADPGRGDRKSTRLNSSHANISYAVFCLKKKKKNKHQKSNMHCEHQLIAQTTSAHRQYLNAGLPATT